MISDKDFEMESTAAVLYCRKNARPCTKCEKPPEHQYEPGCRFVGCDRKDCPCIVDDCNLSDAFMQWNEKQRKLADQKKSLGKRGKIQFR